MRLLKVLPTLAKHPMSSSVIAGTFQSLLQSTSVLQRTAIRLICRTWQVADTVFPILEVELDESHFLVPIKDFETVLCRAASLSDVCKQDADRGVELILSIQACIRSENVVIKAYGLQSLSWLCNHDVIDFYTAWDVLSSSFSELPSSSILGESLCCFLQNGSLDAAAYPESSVKALQLLWKATTVPHESCSSFDWWMVQEKALNALSSFEVEDLIRSSRELKISPAHILLCENHPEVLRACESLIVKFLYHEYKFRNRGTEKERNTGNKLGKIFSALPQILSTSVQKEPSLLRYPAAFMLIKGQVSQTLGSHSRHVSKDWENEFQQQFTEMADHTDLHGNLICGLLYLKVWYFYLYEKLREKSSSNVIISNVALRFLKVLCDISKEAIPRVAENAILAIAVLYQITAFEDPMAAGFRDLHESVVSFLKSCIAQESHEYLQWTSAAALGYVAQYSNTADWRFKLEVSVTLLECLSRSDRDIVRGACNLGLGFLFQNLLTQNEILDSGIYKERMQEVHICDFIFDKLRTLMLTWCPEVSDSLENISVKKDTSLSSNWSEVLLSLPTIMPFKKFEEGTWTLAGLAIALGSSVTALERIGLLEPLSKVTSLLIKVADMSQKNDGNKDLLNSFALGAYISLPLCMKACLRLQILREEFDSLIADIQDYMISVKSTGSSAFPEYKMAACIGSGNVFSILLSLRTYKLQRSSIFSVIESLKSLAVCNNNELLSLGGFVGLANVLGAGTALLIPEPKYRIDDSESLGNMNGAVESINICAPLLYETSCKEYVQTLLQYIVNAAIKGFDRTKPNAWLTLALIRRTFMKGIDTERYLSDSRGIKTLKMSMDGLAKDSTLYLLCDWLLNMKENLMDPSFPYHSLASVLRCLRQAPKLPNLEWGAILRKLFHDITSTKEYPSPEFKNFKVQDDLFSECMLFSLAHAQSFSGLQTCLDELCDLALLLSLRTSMASILMVHMNKLSYIFSKSRLERFVFECVEATWRRSQSNHSQNLSSGDDVECLKVNLWKGLKSLLSLPKDDLRVGVDKNKLLVAAEKCLSLLEPPLEKSPRKLDEIQEWSEALECMVLASDEWIAKLTEIDQNESVTTIPARSYIVKKIYLTSQLVARHRLQSAALMNPIKWLRNQTVNEAYPLLLWIVYALRDVKLEDKQSWLMDVLEMVFCSTNSETVVVFLALLTSSWCPYSTFILVDGSSVLQLLPFTLSSLLSEQSWRAISKGILQRCVSLLFNAAETNLNSVAHGSPLWYVKKACIILRNSLPLQDQVRLVDDLW
ncbi:hypothetical protein KP509_12G038700 [Ceratopteris richardii]|nr:hypothetical protein KP509_12G038700 [Ceratopteris richardii]KAH7423087.1 hypothetical protein KP509_12G038700 [Ceratopteris richardii]